MRERYPILRDISASIRTRRTVEEAELALKLEGELSWSGNTLVVYGVDPEAARLRQAYGAFIWKSADDGETWTDETGDLATQLGITRHDSFAYSHCRE